MRYFEILEDTLVVNRCPSFSKNDRKRLVQHPKYYFFDNGVLNALLENFTISPDRQGSLFEQLFFNQLWSGAAARDLPCRISTYRTEHGAEVDFIVETGGEVWAVELKASKTVGPHDLRGLRNFSEFYRRPHQSLIAYWGSVKRQIDGTGILPWQDCLQEMGL